jgi:hypothetical protein
VTSSQGRTAVEDRPGDRRRGIIALSAGLCWITCIAYGFRRYGDVNPEPTGIGRFLAGVVIFLVWQVIALARATFLRFVGGALSRRAWRMATRFPLLFSGGAWLIRGLTLPPPAFSAAGSPF